ncbi:MAG TPA: hypothetical protein VLM38_12155 [Blastocatellia bacterium]|nr:hypothetical protein [Blastocatellia bacterium]
MTNPADKNKGHKNTARERRSIELHIEELVLQGFPAGDRYRIADGLQLELTRLLTEENFSLRIALDTRIESLDVEVVRVISESKSGLIGGQLAHALFGGLTRSSAGSQADSRRQHFEGSADGQAGVTRK